MADDCVQRHQAVLYDRGGVRRIDQVVDLASVSWSRAIGRKTQATVRLSGRACRAQSTLLGTVQPRRHELVIFRGQDRVWEGPIVQAESTSTGFTIIANDILDYVEHRALTVPWPSPDNGGQPYMVDRIREILEHELATDYAIDTPDGPVTVPAWENLDPPINVLPHLDVRGGTTRTYAETAPFEMTVGEHLYNLGRSLGVSFTALGRSLVVWDGSIGRLRPVTEADFSGDFTISSDGADFFNVAHVSAESQDEDAPSPIIAGHAVSDLDYYGPWERIASAESEDTSDAGPSEDALATQARRSLAGRYPVPMALLTGEGSSLRLSPGITINQLVAGVEIPVVAEQNIRRVKQVQVLQELRVAETAEGESVAVTLSGLGRLGAAP